MSFKISVRRRTARADDSLHRTSARSASRRMRWPGSPTQHRCPSRPTPVSMKTLHRWLALAAFGFASLFTVRAVEDPAPAANPDYIPCKIFKTVAAKFPSKLLYDGVVRG